MNVLFICNQNKHRSKTAEELFSETFVTKSAGLYNERPVSADQLLWADVIAVMDDIQRLEIVKRFPVLSLQKRIVSLHIPDTYYYQQPALVEILKSKIPEALL